MVMIQTLERKYLNSGNRIVQSISNGTVLKFGCPASLRSGGQNILEGQAWDRVKNLPGILDVVVPVLDYSTDGTWLLMPRVRRPSYEDTATYSYCDELEALKICARRVGLGDTARHDTHFDNVGYNDAGILVLLDYGFSTDKRRGFGAYRAHARKCSPTCTWAVLSERTDDDAHGGY